MKLIEFTISFLLFLSIFIEAVSKTKRMTHKSKKLKKAGSRTELTELQIIGSYATLCYLAYLPNMVQKEEGLRKRGWVFIGKATYENFNNYAYVAYNLKHKIVVTVFRGTDNIANWIINYQWQKAEYTHSYPEGVSIHAGFNAFYWSLADKLDKLIYEAVQKMFEASKGDITHTDVTFVVTGHSLGGAAATLYARYLQTLDTKHYSTESYMALTKKYDRPKVKFHGHIKLFTFGTPRIGNKVFANTVNDVLKKENIYNVIFKNDPVPKVNGYNPNSFVHVGTIYKCESTESCTKYFEDPQDSITLSSFMSAFWSLNDHSAENYFKLGQSTQNALKLGFKDNSIIIPII